MLGCPGFRYQPVQWIKYCPAANRCSGATAQVPVPPSSSVMSLRTWLPPLGSLIMHTNSDPLSLCGSTSASLLGKNTFIISPCQKEHCDPLERQQLSLSIILTLLGCLHLTWKNMPDALFAFITWYTIMLHLCNMVPILHAI